MKKERIDPNRLADTKWKCRYHIALPIENEIKQAHGSAKRKNHVSWSLPYGEVYHMVKCDTGHYGICAEVQTEGVYRRKTPGNRGIIRKPCLWEKVETIEGEVCPDHIHMLVSIPPKMSVNECFGGYGESERKSALFIFQKWGNMKFAYRNREFVCTRNAQTHSRSIKAVNIYVGMYLNKM